MASHGKATMDLPESPSTRLVTVRRESAPPPSALLSTLGIVFFALATIVSVLQLIIGSRYAGQCPLDGLIPRYLIIAGILCIILGILGCIQNVIGAKVSLNVTQPVPRLILLILAFVIAALFLFLVAWFVVGCYWVFRSWNIVQYDDPDQDDYCHPFLYRFAYWMLLLTLIVKLLVSFHSSARMPTQLRSFRNSNTAPPATGL